jgi:DNA replication protein DnaC
VSTRPDGGDGEGYGEASGVYCNVQQLIPEDRVCLLLRDLFGATSLCAASVTNWTRGTANKMGGVVEHILARLTEGGVRHLDETGLRVAGKMRFPNACIEDVDFAASRGLDRRQILSLAQGDWIKAREQIILTGQTGTGKTWLACAFGHQAARLDHSVLYVRMPRLFEDMAMARLDGRFPRLVDKLSRVQLLMLDDWGTHGLTDQQRLDLLELFEERYQRRSTIITAQLPVSGWHDMIGEPTIADAILDRIVHNAHRIDLKGDSMRRKDRNANLTSAENTETIHTET